MLNFLSPIRSQKDGKKEIEIISSRSQLMKQMHSIIYLGRNESEETVFFKIDLSKINYL